MNYIYISKIDVPHKIFAQAGGDGVGQAKNRFYL